MNDNELIETVVKAETKGRFIAGSYVLGLITIPTLAIVTGGIEFLIRRGREKRLKKIAEDYDKKYSAEVKRETEEFFKKFDD